jgi:hypothetical protein
MGARVCFDNYSFVYRDFGFEEVSYVFFVVDFPTVLHGVRGVTWDKHGFRDGDAFLVKMEKRAVLAVTNEFYLAGVQRFFPQHLHDVAGLEPSVFALRSIKDDFGIVYDGGGVFAFGYSAESFITDGESDFSKGNVG